MAYAVEAGEPELEEIIVTGSYLQHNRFDMALPVEVIDAGTIQTSGYTNIGSYIRDLTYLDAFGQLTDALAKRNGATDIVPPIPRYRTNLRLHWLKNSHAVSIVTKYTPALDFDGTVGPSFVPGALEAPDEIDSYTTVDVRYSYLFENLWGGDLGLAVGSNNVLDEDPQPLPILGGLETRLQNPIGRTWYVEFTYSLE